MTMRPSDELRAIYGSRSLEYAIRRPSWHQFAECRGAGPELFYVAVGQSTAPAIAMCNRCQVARQCYDAAMSAPDGKPEPDGIWSGQSPRKRAQAARDNLSEAA